MSKEKQILEILERTKLPARDLRSLDFKEAARKIAALDKPKETHRDMKGTIYWPLAKPCDPPIKTKQ